MIILGIILLVVGYVTGISIVYSIGGLLGGRKVWF